MEEQEQVSILIVELDTRLMMNLELIAREEDLKVLTCKDGLEVLKIIREKLPSLAIIDMNVPGLEAFDLCRLVKFDDRYQDIKVIILGNTTSNNYEEKAIKAGADDFLVKPLSNREMLSHIQMAVGCCRWRGQKIIWMDKS
ncbi:MAG: response regulator [Candidatus Eremiobacteraeota bacterium]|nr:response regulator [Candidatus Eremiobacteraeota bacterium]